jgi:arylsulfatase A-like enzyme
MEQGASVSFRFWKSLAANGREPWRNVTVALFVRTCLGFGLCALVQVVVFHAASFFASFFEVARHRDAAGDFSMRIIGLFYQTIQAMTIGALVAMVLSAWHLASERRVKLVLIALIYAASIILVDASFGQDVQRRADVLFNGIYAPFLFSMIVALAATAPLLAHLLGWIVARSSRRVWGVVASISLLAGLGANAAISPDDHAGGHGFAGFAMALAASSLLRGEKRLPQSRHWQRAVLGAALLGLLLVPSHVVRAELFRVTPAFAPWIHAKFRWPSPRPAFEIVVEDSPWMQSRADAPEVPSSQLLAKARAPVVVFITVDAMRADVFDEAEKHGIALPNFSRLRNRGAMFSEARSPASQTAVSLTSAFSGLTFSQLRWLPFGEGNLRFLYAQSDPAPRFPEILTAHGVSTDAFPGLAFLDQKVGILRGFERAELMVDGRRHAHAKPLVDALLARLETIGNEPAFLYVHLLEPHWPYDRGALKEGTHFERYLSEVASVDEQIGRIHRALRRRFARRGFLIVSADHGEAFGEHGTTLHTKTIYDELLRIPLLVQGPGVASKTHDVPVSLIDIGPTILDLFGIATPGTYMGQSLVPILAGRESELSRPIVAEGRLRRAILWNGLKVIEDSRRKIVEVYDLQRDPFELHNIFEAEPERTLPALAALYRYFDAHTLRLDGYEQPYRP